MQLKHSILSLIIFLTLSIFLAIHRDEEDVYPVSGQAWFFGFRIFNLRINLPGFSQDVYKIFDANWTNNFKMLYYLIVIGIVWISSYLLLISAIKHLTGGKMMFASLLSISFHLNPIVMKVFLSAPLFDYFPKVHLATLLFWLWTRKITGDIFLTKRFLGLAIIILFGISCTIRLSCLTLIPGLFIIADSLQMRMKTRVILVTYASIAVLICIYLKYQLLQVIRPYFMTSGFLTNESFSANSAHETKHFLPFKDSLLQSHYWNTEYFFSSRWLIDKLYSVPPLDLISSYFRFISENSIIANFLDILGYNGLWLNHVCFILLILITVRSIYKYREIHDYSFLIHIFIFTIAFSFLSRQSLNQDLHLLLLDVFLWAIIFRGRDKELPRSVELKCSHKSFFSLSKFGLGVVTVFLAVAQIGFFYVKHSSVNVAERTSLVWTNLSDPRYNADLIESFQLSNPKRNAYLHLKAVSHSRLPEDNLHTLLNLTDGAFFIPVNSFVDERKEIVIRLDRSILSILSKLPTVYQRTIHAPKIYFAFSYGKLQPYLIEKTEISYRKSLPDIFHSTKIDESQLDSRKLSPQVECDNLPSTMCANQGSDLIPIGNLFSYQDRFCLESRSIALLVEYKNVFNVNSKLYQFVDRETRECFVDQVTDFKISRIFIWANTYLPKSTFHVKHEMPLFGK